MEHSAEGGGGAGVPRPYDTPLAARGEGSKWEKDVLSGPRDLMRENVTKKAGNGVLPKTTREIEVRHDEEWDWCLVFRNNKQQNSNRRHMERVLEECGLEHIKSLSKCTKKVYVRFRASRSQQGLRLLQEEAERIGMMRRLSPLQSDIDVMESRRTKFSSCSACDGGDDDHLVAENGIAPHFKDAPPHHHDTDLGCAPYQRRFNAFFEREWKSGARQQLVRSIFERELKHWVIDVTDDENAHQMSIMDLADSAEVQKRVSQRPKWRQVIVGEEMVEQAPNQWAATGKLTGEGKAPICHDVFPLHCERELLPLRHEWAWFSSRRSLKPWRWSRVPLNSIREYFGEEIALYYAWLLEYTHALIYPAIIGVACSCTQWGPFLFHENGGPFGSPNSTWATGGYAVFLCCWSSLLLEQWRRRENVLRFRWGTEGFTSTAGSEGHEPKRKEFEGAHPADAKEQAIIREMQADGREMRASQRDLTGRAVPDKIKRVMKELADHVHDERTKSHHDTLVQNWRIMMSALVLLSMIGLVAICCVVAMYMRDLSVECALEMSEDTVTKSIATVSIAHGTTVGQLCIGQVSLLGCGPGVSVVTAGSSVAVTELCADVCVSWRRDNCTLLSEGGACGAAHGRTSHCIWRAASTQPKASAACLDRCVNNVRDGDEERVDCGGDCQPCAEVCTQFKKYGLQVTGSAISVVAIFVFEYIYSSMSERLTAWENWRTETEHQNSLILKNFIFAFVNNYFFIFFIVFFKHGELFGAKNACTARPFDGDEWHDVESCPSWDELQLAVVFFAKVYLKQVWEYYHQYVTRGVLHSRTSGDAEHSKLEEKLNRNEMKNASPLELECAMDNFVSTFADYDDLAIQFGFITIFAAAFPLAPFLAYIANTIEMCIDAQSLTGHHDPADEVPNRCRPASLGRTGFRRPEYRTAEGLGAWNTVFNAMNIISILTNAFIVGFMSILSANALELPLGEDIADRVPYGSLWAALVIVEHAALLVRLMLTRLFPETPEWLRHQKHNRELFRKHLMSDGSTDASLDDGTYEDVAGGELSSPEGASSPMGTLTPAASQRP